MMGSLNLELLGQAPTGGEAPGQPCQLIDCPLGAQLQPAVRETIQALEAPKSAFKSKTPADLKKLELLIEHG
ncbi:MAG: hypothetical protein HY700_14280 [Gemmatimonadetes bacterium]|nr:hypothetical protein [Gemmatimonadota bacterium]